MTHKSMRVTESLYYQNFNFYLGLTLSQVKAVCPPDVYPACHNAKDSVTISGPRSSVHRVSDDLKSKGIFAKPVDSAGVPFHSPAMAVALPKFLEGLGDVSQ